MNKISTKLYGYVLNCENDKFYVGICYDLKKRIKSHFNQNNDSAIFTKLYKPVGIYAAYDLNTTSYIQAEILECHITIHFAKLFGIKNVAGGIFTFRDNEIRELNYLNVLKRNGFNMHNEFYSIDENWHLKTTSIDIEKIDLTKIEQIKSIDFNQVLNETIYFTDIKKRLIIIICLHYNVSIKSVIRIKFSDIDRKNNQINIGNKTFYLPNELINLFTQYYLSTENTKRSEINLFPNNNNVEKIYYVTDEKKFVRQIRERINENSKLKARMPEQ